MNQESGAERRANARLNRVLAVSFLDESEPSQHFVIDISASGFRVAGQRKFPPDKQVRVRLEPTSQEPIEGLARVVWVRKVADSGLYELGFELDEVFSPAAFDKLLRYMDKERVLEKARHRPHLTLKDHMEIGELSPNELSRLSVLARICELFNSTFEFHEIMNRVLQVLVEATGAERSMLLLDLGGSSMEVPALYGIDEAPSTEYSRRVVENVLDSGQPLLSLDVTTDARLNDSHSLKMLGTRAILCVPVRTRNRDFGLIYLDNSVRAGAFSQNDLQLAAVIGGLAAAALERAEMFTQKVQGEKMAAVGTMMAGIVDELSLPLSSIFTIGEQLQKRGEGLADPLLQMTRRCRSLVNQLMDTSTEEECEMSSIPLEGVVEATLELVEPQFRGAGVELVRELGAEITVLGNAEQLRQVLLNLLSNAFDAVQEREQPRVGVRLVQRDGVALLVVADNGVGIATEDLHRLFDPFFTTKAGGEGTGLGLSVARKIVLEHGGRIEVAPSASGGALFKVSLPLELEAAERNVV